MNGLMGIAILRTQYLCIPIQMPSNDDTVDLLSAHM